VLLRLPVPSLKSPTDGGSTVSSNTAPTPKSGRQHRGSPARRPHGRLEQHRHRLSSLSRIGYAGVGASSDAPPRTPHSSATGWA
jgi:hypothetical protein